LISSRMRAPALIGICLVTMAFVGFQDVVLGSPESAVEKSVRLTQEEIDFLLAKGAQPDDEGVRALEAERDELMTQLDDPPPRLPDPGEVQRILMHTPSEPDWDSGEIQCEGSLALRDIEFESAPRCVAVPRSNGNLLTVYLTAESRAVALHQTAGGRDGGVRVDSFNIPRLDDLKEPTIDVDGDLVVLTYDVGAVTIDTSAWFGGD